MLWGGLGVEIWKWGALAAVVVVGATAASVQAGIFNPFDSSMTRACETTFKKRLRSPSGYRRIELATYEKPMSLETYLQMEKPGDQNHTALLTRIYNRAVEGGSKPVVLTSYITYDAPNAYGALIRGTIECEYASTDGGQSDAREYSVLVDGKTSLQWIVDQAQSQ
nr:MAG TPA: hypothetical protein [Caudoviricetes sp.]